MRTTGISALFIVLGAQLCTGDSGCFSRDAGPNVAHLVASRNYPPPRVGMVIEDVLDSTCRIELNADSLYNPASVAKLVTGALALERLGPAYTFKTGVYTSTPPDSRGQVGTLWIRGTGDPGLFVERIWLLVQQIRHAGVSRITGDLVLDDSFFDSTEVGPGFDPHLSSRSYECLVGALSANYNSVAVHIRPGDSVGAPVRTTLFPPIRGARLSSTALTVASGSARKPLEVVTRRSGTSTEIVVSGTLDHTARPRYIYRKVWQTWQNFGNVFWALCEKEGIGIDGTLKRGPVPDTLLRRGALLEFESQPLSEFVNHLFKHSSNFASEMIFKTLSALDGSSPGSWDGGAAVVDRWWKERSLPAAPVLVNGSGMGNVNRISARQVTALLKYVHRQNLYAHDFISALCLAGVDGTARSRFVRSSLRGIVRAKTGTLNDYGVSSLAGYILLPERTLAFCVMINDRERDQVSHWRLQESLIEAAVHDLRTGSIRTGR